MAQQNSKRPEPLLAGHPCKRCQVRDKAFCGVLDCESLAELKKLGSTIILSGAQTLFREGEPANRVFTVTRGSLKLHQRLPNGRGQRIIGFVHVGDFLDNTVQGRRAFTAEMLEDGELCSFARRRFDSFIATHPAIRRELHRKALAERCAGQLHADVVAREMAAEKVAMFLLLLAERSGRPGDRQDVARLPMTYADVGEYLGVAEWTVSRILSALQIAKIIRMLSAREIEFSDRASLEELAMMNIKEHRRTN